MADTRPARERGLDFECCLSFTARGRWAHFRRIEGNVIKQTYRVMPRTTVAGMIAAILGLERDSYYDLFGPDSSALAIDPQFDLRTHNIPENTLTTDADNGLKTIPGGRQKIKVTYPDSTQPRQQHNYEFLVNPVYRIDVWLADDELYSKLREYLEMGKSHYAPSLGLSECLASIDYHGEFRVTNHFPDGAVEVDSAIPDGARRMQPSPGLVQETERSPGFMEAAESGRRTTGFIDWAFTPESTQQAVDSPISTVEDREVIFV